MDQNIVENLHQYAIMGWWMELLQGWYMHPWEALGDILDLVTSALQ